jgi:NAD(P)-dependent dehydrogenase (short-subunit alcohol dehydrogenase family)
LATASPADVDLSGKVALVTGASRGIGRSIGETLAHAGAHVVLVARSADGLESVRRTIVGRGGSAIALVADVSSEGDVVRAFGHVVEEIGQLDVSIHNAGVGAFGPLSELSVEDFDRVMAVNARGTFLCCREAVGVMGARRQGTIINVSSIVGVRGYPEQSAYAASKHAVMGLTKSLAVEAQALGIRVSAILPGGVDTDLIRAARPDIPDGELMLPEDVSQAVLFLLSLSDRVAVDEIRLRRRTSRPW